MSDVPPPRVFVIVPAAGSSRRMGFPKQLLGVCGQPMLLAAIRPLVDSGVAGVLIVTQRQIAAQVSAALPPGVRVAINDDPQTEMIDSVRIGIRTWREVETLRPTDGFLVCPADQPGIAVGDVEACRQTFEQYPDRIVIAEFQGRRGHPLIFPVRLADFVESATCNQGLNALPRAHADLILRVPCESAGVTRDIDVPGDLQHFDDLR